MRTHWRSQRQATENWELTTENCQSAIVLHATRDSGPRASYGSHTELPYP